MCLQLRSLSGAFLFFFSGLKSLVIDGDTPVLLHCVLLLDLLINGQHGVIPQMFLSDLAYATVILNPRRH